MKRQPHELPRSLRHHAIVALLCGVISYLVLFMLKSSVLFGTASDAALDVVMRGQANGEIARHGPPLTLLDIDDADYARLGRPLVFPRDRLALLLTRVAAAKVALVVIDVDISWPDAPERTGALRAALEKLRDAKGPPVLLVREALATGEDSKLYLPRSDFDDLTGPGSNLRFVVADLMTSEDGIVRRVRPWQTVCDAGKTHVLPGVQLAAWSAYGAPNAAAALDVLDARLNAHARSCAGERMPDPLHHVPVTLAGPSGTRQFVDRPGYDRVVLRFGWKGSPRFVRDASGAIAFAVVPATPLLDAKQTPDDSLLKNRIVVVGISAAAARDSHATPLGIMPGDMLVANLLYTSLGEGPPSEAGLLVGLLIALVMSVITFGLWVVSRRVFDLNVVLVREGLKIVLTGFWAVMAWLFLARGAVLDYAFPQYVVITYLAYSEGFDNLF
jgi:CHASE2 domain-containing sensor protein